MTILLLNNTYLSACTVDDRIMFAILEIEKHPQLGIGYPYLISFNNKTDLNKYKTKYDMIKLDNRTIDCYNKENCSNILKELEKKYNINNLDLGAFQINKKYWNMKLKDYFDLKKSYRKACSIIVGHNKKKWTWSNIANYHSKTNKLNTEYKNKILKNIYKNIKE